MKKQRYWNFLFIWFKQKNDCWFDVCPTGMDWINIWKDIIQLGVDRLSYHSKANVCKRNSSSDAIWQSKHILGNFCVAFGIYKAIVELTCRMPCFLPFAYPSRSITPVDKWRIVSLSARNPFYKWQQTYPTKFHRPSFEKINKTKESCTHT